MTAQLRFDDARLQRMEQATLWLQRMCTAGEDERVVEAWLDWCQRDPLNQQAFDDIAAVWELSGHLSAEDTQDPPPPLLGADAVSGPANPYRRALAASLAGLGLAIIAGTGAWWWTARPMPAEVLTSDFSSPIGVNSVETLADGSVLELGGGTRVTVAIGPRERRVQLHEGELFVTVQHETGRPFLVDAGKLDVIATGTAFNVLRTAERTTVTLVEGSVETAYEGSASVPVRLKPSQQLVYSHASHSFDVREVNPDNAGAWRSGLLYFENEPLSEVLATVNRYAARRIVIEDPRVAAFTYGGTVGTDTTRIESFLGALPMAEWDFPVVVVDLADGRQLIRPRHGARSD